MGNILTKGNSSRHNTNRISNLTEIDPVEHLDSVNNLEEIRVPDKTSKHKSKSISLFTFSKRSFIRKTSSLQPQSNTQNIPSNPLEQLRVENANLKEEILRITDRNLEEHQALNSEVQRLKTENKTLNSALRKLRADKDRALATEKDAVERANNFELEKEKSQRQFKTYREAKENEIRDLYKQIHALQNQSLPTRRDHGNEESIINDALMESGDFRHTRLVNDWLLEGQSGVGVESLAGQQLEENKLKQLAQNSKKSKEVSQTFKAVLQSTQEAGYGIPLTNVYSVFVTSTTETKSIADAFMNQCERLQLQLEPEGKLLTLTYFLTLPPTKLDKTEELTQQHHFSKSNVVIAIVDEATSYFAVSLSTITEALSTNKICFICSVNQLSTEVTTLIEKDLHAASQVHFIHSEGQTENLISSCYERMANVCKLFHDKQIIQQDLISSNDTSNTLTKVSHDVFKSWDMLGMEEQSSIQAYFKSKPLPTGAFGREMSYLNNYITQDGPVMPMLVKGAQGSGISTMFSHWIASIENSLSNSCILYHVADPHSAYSIDSFHLLRRFLILLLDQLPLIFSVKDTEKEFPRWLDRACNKHQNGVVIVIDGIDLIENYKEIFKWMLDPLPVPVRVIVSVTGNGAYPNQWNKWSSLVVEGNREEALTHCHMKMSKLDNTECVSCQQLIQNIMTNKSYLGLISNHLYRNVLCTVLQYMMSDAEMQTISSRLLNCKSLKDLLSVVLTILERRHNKRLFSLVLHWVYFSQNGLTLAELIELGGNDPDLLPILFDLESVEILVSINGLVKFVHSVCKETVFRHLSIPKNIDDASTRTIRQNLVDLFEKKLTLGCVSYRVADELPAQLAALKDKESLFKCLSSIFVFVHLYRRGRLTTLVNYWKILSRDTSAVKDIYCSALQSILDESKDESSFNEQITMLYDLLGDFYKDLGLFSIAQKLLEKSLELKEEHLEPDDILLTRSYFLLARLFTQWKKYQTAEEYLKQALECNDVSTEGASSSIATILEFLAMLCQHQEKGKDADIYRKNAIGLRDTHFFQHELVSIKLSLVECTQLAVTLSESASSHVTLEETTGWLVSISFIYFHLKQYSEAAEVLQQALRYLTKDNNGDMQNYQAVIDIQCKLSFVYTTMGQNDKAESMLERALNIYFTLNLLEDPNLATVINSLVKLYRSQKRMDSLERLHRSHMKAMERYYGVDDIRVAHVINELAVHLSKMNKFEEAIELYEQAMNVYINQLGFQDVHVSEVLSNLAHLFSEQRQGDLA
eukprot:TCONS_00072370-protein